MSKSKGLEWIAKNKKFLTIRGINKHLNETTGMPKTSLMDHFNGSQEIGKKWVGSVDEFVKELKK